MQDVIVFCGNIMENNMTIVNYTLTDTDTTMYITRVLLN